MFFSKVGSPAGGESPRRRRGMGSRPLRFCGGGDGGVSSWRSSLLFTDTASVRRASAAAPQPASETDQGQEVVVPHLVASVEEVELDQTGDATDLAADRLDQRGRGLRGPAGRENIVHHQDALARTDRVLVDLE